MATGVEGCVTTGVGVILGVGVIRGVGVGVIREVCVGVDTGVDLCATVATGVGEMCVSRCPSRDGTISATAIPVRRASNNKSRTPNLRRFCERLSTTKVEAS